MPPETGSQRQSPLWRVSKHRHRLETRCCKYVERLHHRDGPQAAFVRKGQLNIE